MQQISPDDFNDLSEHALSRVPDSKRIVLSTEQIDTHNEALDAYMRINYPDAWVHDKVSSDYIFAATGRLFVRMVDGIDGAMATPAAADGAVYMVTDLETGDAMANEACWVIDTYRLQ